MSEDVPIVEHYLAIKIIDYFKSQELSKIYDLQAAQLTEIYVEQRRALHGGDYFPSQECHDRKGIKKSREDKFGTIDPDAWAVGDTCLKQDSHKLTVASGILRYLQANTTI